MISYSHYFTKNNVNSYILRIYSFLQQESIEHANLSLHLQLEILSSIHTMVQSPWCYQPCKHELTKLTLQY